MSQFQSWNVMNLDLSQGIPHLPTNFEYAGFYIVFWWHDIPLGHVEISSAQLPISSSHLARLAVQEITKSVGNHLLPQSFKAPLPVFTKNPARDHAPNFNQLMKVELPLNQLNDLGKISQTEVSPDTTVSVVVCTRDRPAQLARCLRSLQALSPKPQEIIVVDNAPTSETSRQIVNQIPGIRYILEPRPGLSIARNTGIQHSTGDIIAFTDDDVVVHPNWVQMIKKEFYDPKVMVLTGLILPTELETQAQLIFQRENSWSYRELIYDQLFFQDMKCRGVPVWRIGAGANMSIRRQAFERLGSFDERLGAGASGCSEDSEFWYRVLAEGCYCRYTPRVVVFHTHRRDWEERNHQAFQYMQGHVVALLIQFARYGHWGNLRRLAIALPRYYSRLLWRALRRGPKGRYKTILAEIAGCISGIQFYLRHPTNPSQDKEIHPDTLVQHPVLHK